jgi:DNA-binding NarL/FixJ family response regulator
VIYVENDPALLGFMTTSLAGYAQIELIGSYATPGEALDRDVIGRADVALLDLNLGPTNLSGIELGIAMRNINEHIGLVVYSQYSMVDLARRVPEAMREGWSFLPKSPTMDLDEVVRILVETARGMSHGFLIPEHATEGDEAPSLDRLSPRQRIIMSLMSSGVSAKSIAEQVDCSYEALRQELTICYRILAPSTSEMEDRRVKAILTYLELAGRQA